MNYMLPYSRAGLGNRILNLIDAISKAEKVGTLVATNDAGLRRLYKGPKYGAPFFYKKLMLSEVLFKSQPFKLDEYFYLPSHKEIDKMVVAIHFRGRDFAKWKAHSIIGEKFFIEQIERENSKATIYLFTDDIQHQTVRQIASYFKQLGRVLYLFSGCEFADFSLLARAGKIIASPSTFSLCASLLGAGEIIYPLSYAKVEASSGSLFWEELVQGNKPNYLKVDLA